MTFSDQYYHILNRGNGKEEIFLERANYLFFLKRLGEYLEKYNTILVCYCLMPNHFHLILKETEENGIPHLMLSLQTSYAKAFNKRYGRSGHLFQDTYKYIRIESNEYLIHLSRYIHLNSVKAGLVDKAEDWEFSSYCDYIGLRNGKNSPIKKSFCFYLQMPWNTKNLLKIKQLYLNWINLRLNK